ncbi:hypothetical protein [Thalassovita sp.]|nr:hypothetical protein [Thalassovita sp.]MDF1801700.1 hypothetical protein [Thalassovita sp.]
MADQTRMCGNSVPPVMAEAPETENASWPKWCDLKEPDGGKLADPHCVSR